MPTTITQRIVDLAYAGHPVAEIANALGVSDNSVRDALRDLTHVQSGGSAPGSVGQRAIDLAYAGHLVPELADMLGISENALRGHLANLSLTPATASVGGLTRAGVIATGLSGPDIGAAAGFVPTAVKSAPYTLAAGEYVPVDASGGAVPLTLPTTPADKTRLGFKIIAQAATPNNVTVTRGGADVFNKAGGSTTLTFMALNTSVILQYDAATGVWYAQSTDTPLNVASGAARLGTDGKVGGVGGSALTDSVDNVSSAYAANELVSASSDGGVPVNQSWLPIGGAPSFIGHGIDIDANYVYFVDTANHSIGRASIAGTGLNRSWISGRANIYGGDMLVTPQYVYWCETNAIVRANLDGSNVTTVVSGLAHQPDGVTVTSSKLYWCSWAGHIIGQSNLDGSAVNEALVTNVVQPWSITTDGTYLYWTEDHGYPWASIAPATGAAQPVGLHGCIARAALDGTGYNPTFIANVTTDDPKGIAVKGGYIYWCGSVAAGALTDTENYIAIGRATSDGTSVNPYYGFVQTTDINPRSLKVDGTYIYLGQVSGGVARGALRNTSLQATHSDIQAALTAHLANPNPATYTGQADAHGDRAYVRNLIYMETDEAYISGATGATWVCSDGKSIYWCNAGVGPTKPIGSAKLDGTNVNQSIATSVSDGNGACVNAGFLYMTNGFVINRMTTAGAGQTNLISGLTGRPNRICTDGTYLYWTQQGTTGKIGRANLDGTGVNEAFISGLSTANSQQDICTDGTYIYWGYANGDIFRANIDGTNVKSPWVIGGAINSSNYGLNVGPTYLYVSISTNRIARIQKAGVGQNTQITTAYATDVGPPYESKQLSWISGLAGQPHTIGMDAGHLYWNYGSTAICRSMPRIALALPI